MPTASKLPSGKWRVQASKKIDGKLVKKSFTDSDKRKAEQLALYWQTEAVSYTLDDLTVEKAFERYIEAKKNVLSPSTIQGYKNLSKNSLQDIMPYKVSKLTQEQIQKSVNIFAAGHSSKSTRNCWGLLSAVLKMFRPNFNVNISLPQKDKKEIYVPTDEDIKKLLSAAKGTDLYIPILLAAFGGMREGEICALTDNDILDGYININKSMVLADKEWKIKPPKTYSSNRKVEMPEFIINELKDKNGRIVNRNPHAVSIAFNRLLKKQNLPLFRFHDLRHYYVSSLHALGIPDKYIMAQGGWSTNHTMQTVYNHIMSAKQTEFSTKVTNHFNNVLQNKDQQNGTNSPQNSPQN